MAEQKSLFSQLKGLGKELDRRIPELEAEHKRRDTTDEKAAHRTLLLRQLQEDVDSKKKEYTKLSDDINHRGMEFSKFLQLAKIVTQQQSQKIKELQSHLQKYGYEPPVKQVEGSKDSQELTDDVGNASSPKTSSQENGDQKSPPKQIHQGPWKLDRTPTLEDFGLHPNFMEQVNQRVEQCNRAREEFIRKYGEGADKEEVGQPKSAQPTNSKTPAFFSEGGIVITPGIFDGREVPDTADPRVKYLESPPSGIEEGSHIEIQATPRWAGFQRTMMIETPEPLSVKAKRVAKQSGSLTAVNESVLIETPQQSQSKCNNPSKSTYSTTAHPSIARISQLSDGQSDTPKTPEMVSDVGKKWVKDMKASVRKAVETKTERKKEDSIGTPESPAFVTPGLKLKKSHTVNLTDVPSPQTPVFMTPGLNKTKSMPSLAKEFAEKVCLTPQTPECMKSFYMNRTLLSAKKTYGGVTPKSFTTDDIPSNRDSFKSPEMTHNKALSPPTPPTPEMLTSKADVMRLLQSLNTNKQEDTTLSQKKTAPFGGNVKVRTGVTPLVAKGSHLPFITPGKENRTLNFTGIQPEFNLIVEPITMEEYDDLPNYQRRQFTFNTLNKVVEKINALLEAKLENDEPLQLAENEVVRELGAAAFTLLMIMSCLGRINKCVIDGKFMYTVL